MPPLLERLIGLVLVGAAILGLVLNLFVLSIIPRMMNEARTTVEETLTTLDGTLTTTGEALVIVEQSVGDVRTTMDIAQIATLAVSSALDDTVPLLTTMASITGEELPTSVSAAQRSLDSAQTSAAAVENVLFALNSSLPFLGSIPIYDPEESLTTTLADVSQSLDPLVTSLVEVESSIEVTNENLELIQGEVEELAVNFDRIEVTLDDAAGVTLQYQDVISDQQALVTDLQSNASTWITWGGYFFIMVLVWLIVAQLGLLSQGIEMFLRSRRHDSAAP